MTDRHQVLVTMDSLRWDVFAAARMPFLKALPFVKALTHGSYTLPAHAAFFAGRLPCTFAGPFDTCARSNRTPDGMPLWRLNSPETPGPGRYQLVGRNIVDGFRRRGYKTIGTGGVSWFDPGKPAYFQAIDDFERYRWFGGFTRGAEQVEWVIDQVVASRRPCFVFINFGETHHPFRVSESDARTEYAHGFRRCFEAQRRCAEHLDRLLERLFSAEPLKHADAVVCADHGDCFGEDGLWGHTFTHAKVLGVPTVKVST